MKKTLNIDDQLIKEAKLACGATTDTDTVRLGLEAAESAASLPSTPNSLRSGHDSTRTMGTIANGASSAIPKKSAITPMETP